MQWCYYTDMRISLLLCHQQLMHFWAHTFTNQLTFQRLSVCLSVCLSAYMYAINMCGFINGMLHQSDILLPALRSASTSTRFVVTLDGLGDRYQYVDTSEDLETANKGGQEKGGGTRVEEEEEVLEEEEEEEGQSCCQGPACD